MLWHLHHPINVTEAGLQVTQQDRAEGQGEDRGTGDRQEWRVGRTGTGAARRLLLCGRRQEQGNTKSIDKLLRTEQNPGDAARFLKRTLLA